MYRRSPYTHGVTLIDTLVGTALMLVVFLGIASTFRLAVSMVTSNKGRMGAIALVNERMEYARSLPYNTLGTIEGIPAGPIPQTEQVVLNHVTYTRSTYVGYVDDPADGEGVADSNAVLTDYKLVKVDVSWTVQSGTRHMFVVARISPDTVVEQATPGGTLFFTVENAVHDPVAGATVHLTNPSTTPIINLTKTTGADGTVTFLGAPVSVGYRVSVTKEGYSTDQTYEVSVTNQEPSPGPFTVQDAHTTSHTFGIDVLGSLVVRTWEPVKHDGMWIDAFNDESKVLATTSVVISGSSARLEGGTPYPTSGHLLSAAITPSYLQGWDSFIINDTKPAGTGIVYQVYSGGGTTIVPDSQLPNNSIGFNSGTIDLSGISTTSFPTLSLDAQFISDESDTPTLNSWQVHYSYGPTPLPNIPFSMQGTKTIGLTGGTLVYKYNQMHSSGAPGSITLADTEWDVYALGVDGSTGYDVGSSCEPQPSNVSPGSSRTVDLTLTAHHSNSLLLDVYGTGGTLLPGASVTISLPLIGYSTSTVTDSCGQAYLVGSVASSSYVLDISASGYQNYTGTDVDITGTSHTSVTLSTL